MVARAVMVPVLRSTALSRKESVTPNFGCEPSRCLDVHGNRPLQPSLRDGGELRLARVEGCVDRIEFDERVELRAGSVDQDPLVHQALAEPAIERCADLGVAQLQLGGLYRRRIRRESGLRLVKVARRLVERVFCHPTIFAQH